MKQFQETQKLLLFKEESHQVTMVYRQHKENDTEPVFIYEINKKGDYIFQFEGDSIKSILLEGYDEIPSFISPYGYDFTQNVITTFFKYKLKDSRVDKLVISKTRKSSANTSREFIIDNDEFVRLNSSITQEQWSCNETKKILVQNTVVSIFPDVSFDHRETNSNKKLVLRNLNEKLLDQLTADEVDELGEFYLEAAQKFNRPDLVKRMNVKLSKASQILGLKEVITKFEKLIDENPKESKWQEFFDEYITLFDTRYAHRLNYKNIATGLTKYPDLVLVDIYGYVDFYELKKSGAKLIKYDESHKTWYWTDEVSKVIAQTTDYLQKAKENALSYAQTIKQETATSTSDGITANIVNPKGIIVIGTSDKLNTEKKRHHFKTLRESLKDVEFLLYDELLDRLKNLLLTLQEK